MGGLPDASRVGGTWFPDVDPEEWALPDGLASHVITPALVIDLKKVRRNVAAVKRALGGDLNRWRPHLKTTKMSVVWLELVRAGVKNFKVATTKEAAVLAVTLETYLDRDDSKKRTDTSFAGKSSFAETKNAKDQLRRRSMKEKTAFDVLVAYPNERVVNYSSNAVIAGFVLILCVCLLGLMIWAGRGERRVQLEVVEADDSAQHPARVGIVDDREGVVRDLAAFALRDQFVDELIAAVGPARRTRRTDAVLALTPEARVGMRAWFGDGGTRRADARRPRGDG